MKILCFIIMFFVLVILMFATNSCASTKFYMPSDNCKLMNDNDDYYTCFFVKDGVVHTYKKLAKSGRSSDE